MKKKFISAMLLSFILLGNVAAHAASAKDETVYVSINGDGSPASIKIVNHVYGLDGASEFVDYGNYAHIKNLTSAVTPEVKGDEIKWNLNELKQKEFYYEGSIEKELPIKVEIKYFLDDKEVKAEELAGKTGKLKIAFKIKFNKDNPEATKLMAQIQAAANLDVFTNINTEDGNKVVVGKTANINFVALPPKDAEFTLEMEGKDIELEPITITVLPAAFNLPEDIKTGMDSLTQGLGDMEKASKDLEGGMAKAIDGTGKLKNGMNELNGGLNNLYKGSNEIYTQSKKLSSGMNEFQKGLKTMSDKSCEMVNGLNSLSGGLNELSQNSAGILQGLDGLQGGAKSINDGLENLSGGASQLKEGHDKLTEIAKLYADSPDPMVQAMAKGILEEKKGIDALSGGLQQSAAGMKNYEMGVGKIKEGYKVFNKGLSDASAGMKEAAVQSSQLPAALSEIHSSFASINDGTSKLFNGLGDISSGIGSMKKGTDNLPNDVGALIKGEEELKKGINKLGNEGIKKARVSLEDNLNNSFLGNNKENIYTSFADNHKNKNSTVQFIMRTPEIKKTEDKKSSLPVIEEKNSLWQRFLDLFKK